MSANTSRQPLFSVATHRAMRGAWGLLLTLGLVGMLEVAVAVIRHTLAAADARPLSGLWVLALMLVGWLAVARFFFRQQPMWGTIEGLEVGSGRRVRHIPWSKVGSPEWAWYSFDAPGSLRIAYVEIADAGKRIYFWADAESVERLAVLRERAVGAGRAETNAVEGDVEPVGPRSAGPTFPYAFVPLVLALVIVGNLLVAILRGGHAAIAATFIVAVAAVVTLVLAFRRGSNG
jgi:hypothetical protein